MTNSIGLGAPRATFLPSLTCALAMICASASIAGAKTFDIPTGAPPSPLFGAMPFTQHVLHLEEFGNRPMPTADCADCVPLPAPASCTASPDGAALDQYLKQPLFRLPTREANTTLPNPWEPKIEECVRELATSAIEGRPSGEYFAHQRWSEFQPSVFIHAAQAGARTNTGLRDSLQRHKFAYGEFGPSGLYHRGGTNAGIQVRFHPNLPVQQPNSLWTHDGTFPIKLVTARYGEGILFRHHNALPVDVAANNGFGTHTVTTHLHNAHNPAEVDGFANAFFFPGQYFDYRWPMILAGHDTVNTAATDYRAARPNGSGGTVRIRGDWRETMSTLWFHDHTLDYTAQNVYKGNMAVMNIFSAVDRGKEGYQCHYNDPAAPAMPTNAGYVNLCLPSGTALDWGNRDYDADLVFSDRAWDKNGQLYFNKFNTDGFLGDRVLVNGLYKPFFNVRARKYRLRILSGAVSRYWKFTIVTASGVRVPFHMIANDGNIMEHTVAFPNASAQELPSQGIGERYDIIVDFKPYAPGTKLYVVNLMEHDDGKGPKRVVPLNEVMNGSYFGDPAVGKVLEFRVQSYAGTDRSMNPADYVEGKKKMIPRAMPTSAELATARRRTFEFGRSSGTDLNPWTIKTDGGQGYGSDMHRVSASPTKNAWEIWNISTGGGWAHPVHIHFEEGRLLSRDGGALRPWEQWARKDMYSIGDTADMPASMEIAIRFREFMGTYMEHCHNTTHEDHAMLLRFDNKNPGQTIAIPTPIPTWEGTLYEPSFHLDADGKDPLGFGTNAGAP